MRAGRLSVPGARRLCAAFPNMRTTWAAMLTLLVLAGLPSEVWAQVGAARPTTDGGPTIVRVAIYILDIDHIASSEQTFTGSVYLEARWRDPGLAHGRKTIKRTLDQIWHPQLQIANLQRSWTTFPLSVDISGNGEVILKQRYWGWFLQPLALRKFPFDQQVLNIPIVAAGYGSDEVQLVPLSAGEVKSGVSPTLSIPDWTMLHWNVEPTRFAATPGGSGMAAMKLTLTMQRHWESFLFKVLLPVCLIVAMSWICFWLGPDTIATNISVAVTSMLTMVAYRYSIGQSLPLVPYITRLDAFILLSMMMVFATVIQVTIDAILLRKGRSDAAARLVRVARIAYPMTFVAMLMLIALAI